MQAQSYPPERPLSSSRASSTENSSYRPTRRQGPHVSATASDPTSGPSLVNELLSDDVRQAAQLGDFRAIAMLLNHRFAPFYINAWVGEAGPGYLQVTLTVKRPPKRQPLIRLISHQLYSLKSEVILGANLTVQLAETNFILWSQLVRLPLPEIYKPPSRWEICQETFKTATQSAQTSIQVTKAAVQSAWQTSQLAWQTSKNNVVEWVMGEKSNPFEFPVISDSVTIDTLTEQIDEVRSEQGENQPHYDNYTSSTENQADVLVRESQSAEAKVRNNKIAELLAAAFHSDSSRLSTEKILATETTDSVERVDAESQDVESVTQKKTEFDVVGVGDVAESEVVSAVLPPFITANTIGDSSAVAVPDMFDKSQERDVTGHRVLSLSARSAQRLLDRWKGSVQHPMPWLLGGGTIAVLTIVVGFNGLTRYWSTRDSGALVSLTELGGIEPVASDEGSEVSGETAHVPEAKLTNQNRADDQEKMGIEGAEDVNELMPMSVTGVPRSDRPSTISTAMGDVEVVPIVPATSSFTDVTLTFSNDAIVPLSSSESIQSEGWRWRLSAGSKLPITHAADVAIAWLKTPLISSRSQTTSFNQLSAEVLRQGGIDLVNIAATDIARTSGSSLSDTLELLEQSSILPVGAGLNLQEAAQPQILDIKGHRIAILGYVDTHLYKANNDMSGNNPVSLRRLIKDIEAIRDQVDWVIVTYQWEAGPRGSEQEQIDTMAAPSEQQVKFSHVAVDHGADLVVGHNAATMQGSEVYKDRPILYSLGPVPMTEAHSEDTQIRADDSSVTVSADLPNGVSHTLPVSNAQESLSPRRNVVVGDVAVVGTHADKGGQTTAMLKVNIRDRQMAVELIPVVQESGVVAFVDNKKVVQKVREFIGAASQSLDNPLPLDGPTQIDVNGTIEKFSNSAAESFQPNSVAPFIDGRVE